jgi:hypothetical protein
MLSRQNGIFRATAWVAVVMLLATVVPIPRLVSVASAQGAGDLARARDHVDFAEYSEALDVLNPLIRNGSLTGTALRDAYVLKARSHIGLGQNAAAEEAFCNALRTDPQWRPDRVVFTQDEIAVFDSAQADCMMAAPEQAATTGENKPWYSKPVTWVVAGVAVIGGILLLGGGDDETPPDPIGDPPPPPTGK